MRGANRTIIAGALLATMLLLQAAPMGAQGTVAYIEPKVEGTPGDNGWFISDVLITRIVDPDWIPDEEANCEETVISEDTDPGGVNLLCFGTTPDGIFGGAVNIKPNEFGVWYQKYVETRWP